MTPLRLWLLLLLLRIGAFVAWAIAIASDKNSVFKLAAMVVAVLAVLHALFPDQKRA